MKYTEITNKSDDELRKELSTMRDKVQELRMKNKLGQTKNTQEMSGIKKDIARILTHFSAKI